MDWEGIWTFQSGLNKSLCSKNNQFNKQVGFNPQLPTEQHFGQKPLFFAQYKLRFRFVPKQKPIQIGRAFCSFHFVVPPGIEPGTHGFSVRCSTN